MKKIDKIMYINSVSLIIFPVLLFYLGFVNFIISIPLSILTIYLAYKLIRNYSYQEVKCTKKYWIIAGTVILLWLFFSGIGDFSFQNHDFHFRHAILRDLVNYSWPVRYEKYSFSYYFSYFLPSALIGKITSYRIANIFLFIYSYICIMSILYLINRYLKKESFWALFLLILFSGLDIIGLPNYLFSFKELEWWNGLFQYSSNTTSIYWTFNQTIPLWLIMSLLLNIKNSNNILFISSLSFFYSPFATIGLIPIIIYLYFKYLNKNYKSIISWEMLFSLSELIILGSLYTSSNSTKMRGFIFQIVQNKHIILPSYLLFIILEVLPYIFLAYKENKQDKLYKIVCIELLIIPIYVMSENNDFCMRASISGLFLLMIYMIKYIERSKKKKIYVYIILLIASISPLHEITRSIYYTTTTNRNTYLKDDIVSIGKPRYYQELVKRQFYGNNNSFYFKYISK